MKIIFLLILSLACRAVNGQVHGAFSCLHSPHKLDTVGGLYLSAWIAPCWDGALIKMDTSVYCCYQGEWHKLYNVTAPPIHKPKKPVKNNVNNLAFGGTDISAGDTGDQHLQRLLSGKDNSDYGFQNGAISTDTVPVHKPKNPVALLDGYPIPDILQRLTTLEKQYQFLVRRVIEMQQQIDSLRQHNKQSIAYRFWVLEALDEGLGKKEFGQRLTTWLKWGGPTP